MDKIKQVLYMAPDKIRNDHNFHLLVSENQFIEETKPIYFRSAKKRVKIARKKDKFLGFVMGVHVKLMP